MVHRGADLREELDGQSALQHAKCLARRLGGAQSEAALVRVRKDQAEEYIISLSFDMVRDAPLAG